MRPDYITARYNVAHRDSIAGVEQSDSMRLSTDAAPALKGMEDYEIKERLLSWYMPKDTRFGMMEPHGTPGPLIFQY